MTPGEAYPIFVEAIQAAKAKGIKIVGGVYGLIRHAGRFVVDHSEADYSAGHNPWVVEREVHAPEVCPVGAVVLDCCPTCEAMTRGVADVLAVSATEVRAITNGVDGTDPAPSHKEWHDLGSRLRREFNIPNVYDQETS